jgi:hypothetical protein
MDRLFSPFPLSFCSDPVAYRLESLLLSPDLSESELPPPMYLTVHGRDVRLHVKAMQIGDVVRKSFFDKKTTGASAWGALLESAVAVVGSQAETSEAAKRGEGGAGRAEAMTLQVYTPCDTRQGHYGSTQYSRVGAYS